MSKRATPTQWAKYTVRSCTIKMIRDGTTPLAKKMRDAKYINHRKPHRGKFIRTVKGMTGREALSNRFDTLGELSFDWFRTDISDNTIRVILKKHIGFGL